jgi:hypothetical protein
MKIFYEDKCKITCTDKDQVVEAEVMEFRPKQNLVVVLAANKIHMKYNGRLYVGNAVGMEFTSQGPEEHTVKQGRGL